MEALGGDQRWADRFLAQHSALFYYWVLVVLWFISPTWAYNFSELIEFHAVDTYGEFVDANEDALKALPAPAIAQLYYLNQDSFLFDEFQSQRAPGSRRPECATLYDTFVNIRDDEAEHVATMMACQDPEAMVRSPNTEAFAIATFVAVSIASKYYLGDVDLADLIGQDAATGEFGAVFLAGARAFLSTLPFL